MGASSAPWSVIMSVDQSHKDKSAQFNYAQVQGWLPTMVADHAAPPRRATKRGSWSRGTTRSAGWAQLGQENPKR